MKKTRNVLFILGLCAMSAESFAGTHEELLKELFEAGTAPACPSEFPERDFGTGDYLSPPPNLCVVVDGTDQPYMFDISRTIRFTSDQGPLVSERREEKLVFGNSRTSFNLFEEPTVNGVHLVLTNPIYKTWVDGHDGSKHFVPAQLFATKSGRYIAFKIFIEHNSTSVKDESYYGYCYPVNGSSLF